MPVVEGTTGWNKNECRWWRAPPAGEPRRRETYQRLGTDVVFEA